LVGHLEDWVLELALVSLVAPLWLVPLLGLPLAKQQIFQAVELNWWLVSLQLAAVE
jgi:hypothetical protein